VLCVAIYCLFVHKIIWYYCHWESC